MQCFIFTMRRKKKKKKNDVCALDIPWMTVSQSSWIYNWNSAHSPLNIQMSYILSYAWWYIEVIRLDRACSKLLDFYTLCWFCCLSGRLLCDLVGGFPLAPCNEGIKCTNGRNATTSQCLLRIVVLFRVVSSVSRLQWVQNCSPTGIEQFAWNCTALNFITFSTSNTVIIC